MKYIKKCVKYIISFICMIIIFFSALYITALIPREAVHEQISKSAEILNKESGSFYYYVNGRNIQIDNYTDAIMLNNIYSIDENNIVESIIKCRRNYLPNIQIRNSGEKVGNIFSLYGEEKPIQDLVDITNGKSRTTYEYARYWHGYMVILKPMLIFFNITQIRIIFEIILCISLFILSFYLYKNVNKIIAILTFITFFSIDILSFVKNLQGIFVFIIPIITSIFIVNKKINSKNINLILFIIGGITAYVDFLTTPLTTILIPAIIYFLIYKEKDLKVLFKEFIFMCLLWGIGYFGIWFSKWIINDCMYNSNLIELSLKQILFRVSSNELVGTKNVPIKALKYNISNACNWISVGIIIIATINLIKNYKNVFNKNKIIYVVIAIIPILWYLFIFNHSCLHYFFTYKLLIVTLLGIVFISFDNEKIQI